MAVSRPKRIMGQSLHEWQFLQKKNKQKNKTKQKQKQTNKQTNKQTKKPQQHFVIGYNNAGYDSDKTVYSINNRYLNIL